MKSSNYNIIIENPETHEFILYNTLNGSLSVWESQNEFEVVREALAAPNYIYDQNIKIHNILVEQKNLIDDSVNEISIIEKRKELGIRDANRLDLIIMPTLECNFSCTYCYEDRHEGRMTDRTVSAIKAWLTTQIPKYKVTMLHWFGGEPLIGQNQLLSITEHVNKIASDVGTKCVIHITTNGYLLNEKKIKDLVNLGVLDYQITVDGPADTHDQLRVLKNGKGTFKRVFQNIILLAKISSKVKISLRVNFNKSNLHSIPKLLEIFPYEIRSQLRVVYEPIFGNCSINATDNIQPSEISSSIAEYYALAGRLGYDAAMSNGGPHPGKLVYCYAERQNQYIINYTGDVFKCTVSKFEQKERVGYIDNSGIFVQDDKQWNRWVGKPFFEEQCYECKYLPLCMGGCRRMRQQNKGTGSNCSLVPTNTSYVLKQIVLGNFEKLLSEKSRV